MIDLLFQGRPFVGQPEIEGGLRLSIPSVLGKQHCLRSPPQLLLQNRTAHVASLFHGMDEGNQQILQRTVLKFDLIPGP